LEEKRGTRKGTVRRRKSHTFRWAQRQKIPGVVCFLLFTGDPAGAVEEKVNIDAGKEVEKSLKCEKEHRVHLRGES